MIPAVASSASGVRARPDIEALRGRKRFLDAAWALTGGALTLVVAMLVASDLIDVQFPSFLMSAIGFAAVYAAGSLWASGRADPRSLEGALVSLQIVATACLGILWLQLGGVAVPALAILFLLPIATSGMTLSRWHPVISVFAAVGVVAIVVGITSPELRWYADGLGIPFMGVLDWIAVRAVELAGSDLFEGQAGGQAAITFVVFLVVASSLGLLASRLTRVSAEVDTAMSLSSSAVAAAQDLTDAIFASAPEPLALLDPETGRITRASRSFSRTFGVDEREAQGRQFLEVVGFHLPDRVETALQGGDVEPTPHSGGGGFGISGLRVRRMSVPGHSLSLATLTDRSLLHSLLAALDADPDILVLVDDTDRIRWINAAGRERFGAECAGGSAGDVLEEPGLPTGWWDPGPRELVRRPLGADASGSAELRSSRIPGTDRRVTWIRLRSP